MLSITLLVVMLAAVAGVASNEANPEGYIIYCPCMGRFGNQMEHFLGVLAFARAINRTLILPPLVEYSVNPAEATMIDFEEYFEVKPLRKYHRVITTTEFFHSHAENIWPKGRRKVLCWSPRRGLYDKTQFGCLPLEGNPSGPFWRHLNVEFDAGDLYYSQIIGHLASDFMNPSSIKSWKLNFPKKIFPVLAFSSAPAAFPVLEENTSLQKYLHWNSKVLTKARQFRIGQIKRPVVGIHLRTDVDWKNVCEHVKDAGKNTQFFASAQCTGYSNQYGFITKEMCMPSVDTILNKVQDKVISVNALSVFVSSDKEFYIDELRNRLSSINKEIRVVRLPENDVHVSLVLLAMSDHFIGNCISTFTAFVVRQRQYQLNRWNSTSFFGFVKQQNKIEL